jgi:hypothetical protein
MQGFRNPLASVLTKAIGQKGRILTTTPPATRNGMRSQFGQMRSEMELERLRKQCGTPRAQVRYLKGEAWFQGTLASTGA